MPRPHRLPRALGCFCLALAVGSCGEDPTGTTGNLQITLSTGSPEFPLVVVPGLSGNTTVQLTRPRGFTGPVQVTASGLPAGVTAEAITIGMDRRTGELSFQAAPEAPQAASIVTVRVTGDNRLRSAERLERAVRSGGSDHSRWCLLDPVGRRGGPVSRHLRGHHPGQRGGADR